MDKLCSLCKKDKNEEVKEIQICFGKGSEEENEHLDASNRTRTSKYTYYSWLPLSILFQFTRAANIYFLVISILTAMPFSPKSPGSMIGTFVAVLIFTSLKELFEDAFRWISDREVNNAKAMVLDHKEKKFEEKLWKNIKLGDIISVGKDETFPCDMLCIIAKKENINVDTMNLDGETMLKPKKILDQRIYSLVKGEDKISQSLMGDVRGNQDKNDTEEKLNIAKARADEYAPQLAKLKGKITCSPPNEDIEHWDGKVECDDLPVRANENKIILGDIDSMLLRGCYLRNTSYCVGIAVHLGKESKIMMNAKKPPRKVSNLMRLMNKMLYTVFGFQLFIISVFATCSVIWTASKGKDYDYIDEDGDNPTFWTWIIQLLTYWVAYSHLIPISLYVMIEVLKLVQALFIKWDQDIGANPDVDEKAAECKNSDLIEELGQVDFIFSDKTGTLT